MLIGNSVTFSYGGGACGCTLNNCTLTGNSAPFAGGGAASCTLNNCTVISNSANGYDNLNQRYFGVGGGAYYCTLNNCTLVGNSAGSGGGAWSSTLNNCINFGNLTREYTCEDCGLDPLFVDYAGGNLRLQSNSPCINAGKNAFAPAGPDLDGNPRIKGGTVDIGAYEFQTPVSTISYAWLQQFNLPINPATDTADPDGDGVDNYHEWLADTNPTNRISSPAQLTLIPYGPNVIFTWPTNAVGFTLQSTTNLGLPTVWSTNFPAPFVIGGKNTVTNPITAAQQFYRLVH